MPTKNDKISSKARRLRILQLLESAPSGGRSCTEISDLLYEEGFNFSRRTIDRDIIQLSIDYGLCDSDDYPAKYSLAPDYKNTYDISLNEENLQTLSISLELLNKLGPLYFSSSVKEIETTLTSCLPKHLRREFERFKNLQVVHNCIPGKAVLSVPKNLQIVLTALRKSMVFSCQYDSRNVSEEMDAKRIRRFGPIMLEMVVGTPYLLVQDLDEEGTKIKRLRISRLHQTKILDEQFKIPPVKEYKQDLDSFEGVSGNNNKPIKISVTGNEQLYEYFSNYELHPSQEITIGTSDDYYCKVEWEMPLNYRHARLLAGFGGYICSIYPKVLRKWVKELWRKGLRAME